MKVFIVSFYCGGFPNNEQKIVEKIKSWQLWARITKNTWCVKNDNLTAGTMRDELAKCLTTSDMVFVVEITNSAWGSYCLPSDVVNWLKTK